MTVPDETLMAYADGELDEATRKVIEAAMREDPGVRKRVEQHRALRDALQEEFSAVLDEPVPARLLSAVRKPSAAPSVKRGRSGGRWSGTPTLAMAASLLMGLGIGYVVHNDTNSLLKSTRREGLVAAGALSNSLSDQLAADRPPGAVATIGLSFRAKSGAYCRTFSLEANAASGLACREGRSWKIQMLAQSSGAGAAAADYRMAASGESPLVRSAVEEAIRGEPLDRAGEIAARQARWVDASP